MPNTHKDAFNGKRYYYEVTNRDLCNSFRRGIIFCLDYLRKNLTAIDLRDICVYSFSSDITGEIEFLKRNFQKRLEYDYSFESRLVLFVSNLVSRHKLTLSDNDEIKQVLESLIDNPFLNSTVFKPLVSSDGGRIEYTRDYKLNTIRELLFYLLEYYLYLRLDREFDKLSYYEAYYVIDTIFQLGRIIKSSTAFLFESSILSLII